MNAKYFFLLLMLVSAISDAKEDTVKELLKLPFEDVYKMRVKTSKSKTQPPSTSKKNKGSSDSKKAQKPKKPKS